MTEALHLTTDEWIWAVSAVLYVVGLAAWVGVAVRILATDDEREQTPRSH